jgi:hypothetical protein
MFLIDRTKLFCKVIRGARHERTSHLWGVQLQRHLLGMMIFR